MQKISMRAEHWMKTNAPLVTSIINSPTAISDPVVTSLWNWNIILLKIEKSLLDY